MKILVVEDEAALASVLKQEVEEAGATAQVAVDGVDALAKTRSFMPDLILLDIKMPNMDGFEVLHDLKEDPGLKHIPVIVLSVLGQDSDIKKAIGLGAVDYYVKTQHSLKFVIDKIRGYMVEPPTKK